MEEIKQTFKDVRPIDVDGITSNVTVKVTFNTQQGTGQIDLKITSKSISPKEAMRQGVLEAILEQMGDAYDQLLELRLAFAEAHPSGDPAQLSIQDTEEQGHEAAA